MHRTRTTVAVIALAILAFAAATVHVEAPAVNYLGEANPLSFF